MSTRGSNVAKLADQARQSHSTDGSPATPEHRAMLALHAAEPEVADYLQHGDGAPLEGVIRDAEVLTRVLSTLLDQERAELPARAALAQYTDIVVRRLRLARALDRCGSSD